MRQKRAKSYRKQLLVYAHTFKFRQPYQVLVDDQIVLAASDSKFYLWKSLSQTLQAEVKPMITQCCMQALYATNNQDAIGLGKSYERRRCNHPPKDAKTPLECIESVVNINGENKHRYVVASQDIELRRKLRRVPGVPILHINRAVMVMEPLSDTSARISKRKEQEKLFKGLNDPKFAGIKHDEEDNDKNSDKTQNKKRKLGPKQPNPLSMKKKKKTETESSKKEETTAHKDANNEEANKKKRKRRHKKKTTENPIEGETTSVKPEVSEEQNNDE
ncbi:rRNA-processing protein Utp23p [Monosporozyma servazzii]